LDIFAPLFPVLASLNGFIHKKRDTFCRFSLPTPIIIVTLHRQTEKTTKKEYDYEKVNDDGCSRPDDCRKRKRTE
jgi:hypothetical protein